MTVARETMSGPDAAWLHMDRPNNLMIVETLLRFDAIPDWDAVETAFADRVVSRFGRFRQRSADPTITFGAVRPRWEAMADFDLTTHIRRRQVDAADLPQLIATEAVRDLDRRRPLWDLTFVDLDDGSALLLLRTHHAIADGAGIVKVLRALADEGTPRGQGSAKRARPSIAGSLLANRKLGSRVFRRGASGAAFSERLTGVKSTASCTFAVDELRSLGQQASASMNDVVLTVVAGALDDAARAIGADHAGADVVMPVDLRPDDDGDQLGNEIGLVFVSLPASGEMRRRLGVVRSTTQSIKASPEATVTSTTLRTLGYLPREAEKAWVDSFIKDAAAVVTNIRGPAAAIRIAGAPVEQMSLLVPSTGSIGIGVSVFSYAGTATISVVTDVATVPDADLIASAVKARVGELRDDPGRS